MQPLIYRTGIFLWLFCTALAVNAQHADTTIKLAPIEKAAALSDKKLATGNQLIAVLDSVAVFKQKLELKDGKMYVVNDTVPDYKVRGRLEHKNDSLFRKALLVKKRNDSIFRKSQLEFKMAQKTRQRNDSLFRKNDSLFKKTAPTFKKMSDSVFRKTEVSFKAAQKAKWASDSVFKKQQMNFKRSAIGFKQLNKLDSLKKLNWKTDSVRLKNHLMKLKINLQRLQTDSTKLLQNKQKKLITKEVDCNENGHLSIDNIGRRLIIKTISGNKIRLETVLLIEEGTAAKEVNWEKDFNIAVTGDPNSVVIRRAGGDNKAPATAQSPAPAAAFKSPLTVYVPASVKINIEHRYNDLVIMNDLVNVKLDLVNTNLSMKNAEEATIKSKYGSVKAGTIKIADLDLLNCTFSSVMMEKMLINSKYSNISVKKADLVTMKSFSDQYKFDKAKDISGSKSFGQFNIVQLDNSITLNGSSADITINKIDSSAKTIKVDNKYADVKLPAEKLQNYSLQFNGTHSNVFTSFDKIKTGATDSTKASNPGFIKTAGDLKKDFTELVVKCSSCSVDFR